MATVHFTAESAVNTADFIPPRQGLTTAVSNDELPLFRFRLRQLFLFVAVISALFAALASSSGLMALVLLLSAIVVVMHVFATALGSRLRERADRDQLFDRAERQKLETIATMAVCSSPRSPWHSRGATVLPWLRQLVIAAIACGGVIGAAYLAYTIGYRTSPAGVIVGSLSIAVLFGWFAFLIGSFYGVFRHGFREALAEQQKDMQGHSN